jgi:hypothetical protein
LDLSVLSQFLRKIYTPKWDTSLPWIPPGGFQAAAFRDLPVENNALSVFIVVDADVDVRRIAAAMAVYRIITNDKLTSADDFGFALVDGDAIDSLGIKVIPHKTTTPDGVVNDMHHNLVELTASKLYGFACLVLESPRGELNEDEVYIAIAESEKNGAIQKEQIPLRLLPKIESASS